MLNILKNELNTTYTENGALTLKSSGSYCLDLFSTIGALRSADNNEIISRFMRAFAEDKDVAMKILFFARDVRGGLGERRIFKVIINFLADNFENSIAKNINFIPEFGRYDDLLSLFGTRIENKAIDYIKSQLENDLKSENNFTLLAKWLPSINASNKETINMAKKLAKRLGMSYTKYRKIIVLLRKKIKILENNLREKDYTFDYSKQPSKAMLKYKSAFIRNDGERYMQFMNKVQTGEAKLNTGALYPYDIVRSCFGEPNEQEKNVLDTTWNSLPNFCENPLNAIAVIDGSGSMYNGNNPRPCDVALSLGLYFAERNRGSFANHFITFSEKPQLIEIKGSTLYEKLAHICSFNEIANTNIQGVFELILNTAIKNNLLQSELPEMIYIISDMEFDCCAENASISNFENIKSKFKMNGYKLPQLIFWNVDSRNMQVPVEKNEQGVALVSGCSPKIFSMAISGEMDPYIFMIDVLGSERYSVISA